MRNTLRYTMFLVSLLYCTFSSAQMTHSARIIGDYSEDYCTSLDPSKYAYVELENPFPIPLPTVNDSYVNYVWTVEHENYTWEWDSNFPSKAFPLPWPGEYKVRAKILYVYVRPDNRVHTVTFFWSNIVTINAVDCSVN